LLTNFAALGQHRPLIGSFSAIILVAVDQCPAFREALRVGLQKAAGEKRSSPVHFAALTCRLMLTGNATLEDRAAAFVAVITTIPSVEHESSLFPVVVDLLKKDGAEAHRGWLFQYLLSVGQSWTLNQELSTFLEEIARLIPEEDLLRITAHVAQKFIGKRDDQIGYLLHRVDAFITAKPDLKEKIFASAMLSQERLDKTSSVWHTRFPLLFPGRSETSHGPITR
jgi:hypothetical protein